MMRNTGLSTSSSSKSSGGGGRKKMTRSQMLRGAYRDQIYNSATASTTTTKTTPSSSSSTATRQLRIPSRRAVRATIGSEGEKEEEVNVSISTPSSKISHTRSQQQQLQSTPTTTTASSSSRVVMSTPLSSIRNVDAMSTPISTPISSHSLVSTTSSSSKSATTAALKAASTLSSSRSNALETLYGKALNDSYSEMERTSLLQRRIDELEDKVIATTAKQSKTEVELKRVEQMLKAEKEEVQRLKEQRQGDAKEHASHIAQVERQRNLFFEREKELQRELEDSEQRAADARKKNFDRIAALESELHVQQNEHTSEMLKVTRERTELSDVNVRLRQRIEQLSGDNDEKSNTMNALNLRIKSLEKIAERSTTATPIRKGKRHADENDNETPTKAPKQREDISSPNTTISETSKASAMRQLRKLERENKRLKQLHECTLVLKEQYATAEAKLSRVEEQYEALKQQTIDYEEIKSFFNQWQSLADAFNEHLLSGEGTTSKALQTVSDLQKDLAAAKHKEVLLQEENKRLLKTSKTNTETIEQLQMEVEKRKSEGSTLLDRVKRISSFRDLYRTQLSAVWDSFTNITKLYSLDEIREKITEEMAKLRNSNELLTKQLCELKEKVPVSSQKTSSSAAKTTTPKIKTKTELDDTLTPTKSDSGADDEKEVLILHMKSNPAVWAARDDIAELRKENEELKMQLSSSNSSQQFDMELNSKVKELQAGIEQRDKKMQRLRQTFSDTVSDFLDACYELTGYKIEMIHSNRFRLRSMYAESADDCIIFRITKEKGVELLQSYFVEQLDESIMECVTKRHSIPSFLSTVTLHLFNKTTIMQ
eukprot:m.175905 g.175905  ORF g.175905 m.175905 type:complete len:828 (+) comp13525_c0_seq5:80-2563(+)